jgi:hypothetical protein
MITSRLFSLIMWMQILNKHESCSTLQIAFKFSLVAYPVAFHRVSTP